jgi:hypothetical protein
MLALKKAIMECGNRQSELEYANEILKRELSQVKLKASVEGYAEQLEPLIRKFFSHKKEETFSKT